MNKSTLKSSKVFLLILLKKEKEKEEIPNIDSQIYHLWEIYFFTVMNSASNKRLRIKKAAFSFLLSLSGLWQCWTLPEPCAADS